MPNDPETSRSHAMADPGTLVSIMRAAAISGDRDLERAARQRLREEYGIRVTIERRQTDRQEVTTR